MAEQIKPHVRLYIMINPTAFDRLRKVAAEDRRRPQDQAAFLLERLLMETDPRMKGIN